MAMSSSPIPNFLWICVARFLQVLGKQPHQDRCSQYRRRRPHITWQPYHACVLGGGFVDLEAVCVSDQQSGPDSGVTYLHGCGSCLSFTTTRTIDSCLILLIFELGSNLRLTIRVTAHELIPLVAIVILTIRRGFRGCTVPPTPHLIVILNLRTTVFSGIPLMRVVYRDSESLTNTSFTVGVK